MELKDFFITPVTLAIIFAMAYYYRNRTTDNLIKKYFIPALAVKIIGAISVGLVYQFYYQGGDTFNFHMGSKQIYEAFWDSPVKAFQLIFADGEYKPSTLNYALKVHVYRDLPSYFVVRVAGIFDILTFHTYSATASLFALLSFTGMWALFKTFYRIYPRLHKEFAVAVLFVPSVFFWGSGILKDTLTIGALGWMTYAVYNIFFLRKKYVINVLIILFSAYVIYSIKIYILLCFLPGAILWIFITHYSKIKSIVTKVGLAPLVVVAVSVLSYYAVLKVGEDNKRYSLQNLSHTAEITAKWLTYVSHREGGSFYTLGDFDYSPVGMARKFIPGIWVTLFRPYVWEAKNPVMLLSALESMAIMLFTVYVFLVKPGFLKSARSILGNPFVMFCLVFSIAFAFAVGFSTYNFGSLVRYKIPMIPFFLSALFIIKSKSAQDEGP
jgi:hypothetical protein